MFYISFDVCWSHLSCLCTFDHAGKPFSSRVSWMEFDSKHKQEQEGEGGTLWYGVVAWRAQRSELRRCGCDSASVPRIRERARELNEVTQSCLTAFFLECLPFSSQRTIKLPAVKVSVERQASLLSTMLNTVLQDGPGSPETPEDCGCLRSDTIQLGWSSRSCVVDTSTDHNLHGFNSAGSTGNVLLVTITTKLQV